MDILWNILMTFPKTNIDNTKGAVLIYIGYFSSQKLLFMRRVIYLHHENNFGLV